jgi:NADH-quinone oxidoreductase subunit N
VSSKGAIFYYLTGYAVASIMAFTVVQLIETKKGNADIDNFKGLFKSNPLLAIAMTVAMFSLAGIPPLAGFFGKYLIFTLSITSLIGVYYYFKPVVAMTQLSGDAIEISRSEKALLSILIAANLIVGIFPDLVRLI